MQSDLEFYKLSGAGNDFIALLETPQCDPSVLAQKMCRRGLSVGADGLFVLERTSTPADDGEPQIRMTHWNADGGTADLCLNGTRCAAALAFELGWTSASEVVIMTGAGQVKAQRTSSGIRTQVPPPQPPSTRVFTRAHGDSVEGFVGSAGVPHVVRLISEQATWESLDLEQEAAWIRHHPSLESEGANVNLVLNAADASHGQRPFAIRTFERGVEGETLACGTGAVAAAAVLSSLSEARTFRFDTRGGFMLTVTRDGDAWYLEGDARVIFKARSAVGSLA